MTRTWYPLITSRGDLSIAGTCQEQHLTCALVVRNLSALSVMTHRFAPKTMRKSMRSQLPRRRGCRPIPGRPRATSDAAQPPVRPAQGSALGADPGSGPAPRPRPWRNRTVQSRHSAHPGGIAFPTPCKSCGSPHPRRQTSRETAYLTASLPAADAQPADLRTGQGPPATVLSGRLPRVAVRGSGRETAGGSAEHGPSWFGSRHSGAGCR